MADTRIDDSQAQNWAQEETLRRLLKEASVTSRVLEDYVKAKLSKDEYDAIRQNVEATKRNTTQTTSGLQILGNRYDRSLQSAYRDLDRSLSSQFKSLTRSMNNIDSDSLVGGLKGAGEKAGKGLMDLSKDMVGFGSRLTFVTGGLLTMGAVVLEGWHLLSNLNDNYLRLYENGVNFTQGLRGMTQATGDLGISTQELVATFGQYSTTVATLGTDRAVKLGKEFVKLNKRSGELGLTNVQATETLLEYANLMRNTGQIGKMSNRELVEGTANYTKELNEITAITGQNRREIQKSIEARSKDLGLQVLLRSLPKEIQDNIKKSMISLSKLGSAGAEAAQKVVVSMLTRGGLAGLGPQLINAVNVSGLTDTFQRLSEKAAAGADVTGEMTEIARAFTDPKIFENFRAFADMPGPVGDMIRSIAEMAGGMDNLNQRQQEIQAAAEQRFKQLDASQQTQLNLDRLISEETAKRNKADEARNKTQTEVQNTLGEASEMLSSVFNTLVVDVMQPMLPVLKIFGDSITYLAEKFRTLSEYVGSFLRSIGFGGGAPARKDEQGNEIPREADWTDTAGSATAAITTGLGLWGLKRGYSRFRGGGASSIAQQVMGRSMSAATSAASAATEAAGGLGSSALGKAMDMVGGGGGNKVTEAITKMGGVDAGAVKGFEATMKGLANGLSAFKNPALVLYAGIFSAALGVIIAGVGAGLAAATWLMGAALPKFAEGMKSFTELDGVKLGEVGKGMTALGAGMALMGAGEVASAFGSIASAITSWWGADPISKLKAFAEVGTPLAAAAEGMQKFATVYPQAINQLNSATLGTNASTVLDQIQALFSTDGSGWFGGEPVIIGQINSLASSIGTLANNAANLANVGQQETQSQTDKLSKRSIEFYDDAKNSYNAMVTLLQSMDGKLDLLDRSTRDGTTEITRALGKTGKIF